jgi:hypothetical protein
MGAYILKRLLLMIPTLLGIMLMTFAVIQFVPGGPVEQVIAKMQGQNTDSTSRVSGNPAPRRGRARRSRRARPPAAIPRPSNTAGRRGSIRSSSNSSKNSSASTSRPGSASC